MCEKEPLKGFNSNKSQDYCDHLCKMLSNNGKCEESFKAAVTLVDKVLKRKPMIRMEIGVILP